MPTRRAVLLAPLAAAVGTAVGTLGQTRRPEMKLGMHQNTSRGAGFRGSLEGWSRAGIRFVELNERLLDAFLETDTLDGARSLLADLDLEPVSASAAIPDLWLPGPRHAEGLESWRVRCGQFAALGLDRIYSPAISRRETTVEDYAAIPGCIREVAEISRGFGLVAMIEFLRTSSHLATLPTTLDMIRRADHPNVKPLLDFFHFWSGLSKFEDLDLLEPGEIGHVHFQDLEAGPRELIDNDSRIIPGDGIAPIARILQKIAEKGYEGVLSVELFRADFTEEDPYEVATEVRRKCEAVMKEAGVA